MCNLIIDEGNTLCKVAVADGGAIIALHQYPEIDGAALLRMAEQYGISRIISASTRRSSVELPQALQGIQHIQLGPDTKLPIGIAYSTPQTLGSDRVAAAVGASVLFPQSDVLIIDIGTAITIDFLSGDGLYHGGIISPGPAMRAKALHTFTGQLPMVDIPATSGLTGSNTTESIQFGISNGIAFEVEGYINRYTAKNQDIKIVVTGGSAHMVNHPKAIHEPNLVLIGMNHILKFAASL